MYSINEQQNNATSMLKCNSALQESQAMCCLISHKGHAKVTGKQATELLHAQKACVILLMKNPCK
jgi:hypothetical protein